MVAPCNMDTVITDVIELLQSKIAHKNVVIVYNPKPDMGYYPANANRMKQLLINLLDNAVKYTSSNGKIRVATECWVMYTKIDIIDNGKGISESRQAEIFKRFYREEDVHDIEGIGIGLYLSRKIISLQGGYIKVTSDIGKGSTFSIFLPNK